MNLITDSWIPVSLITGKFSLVGLLEGLSRAEEIADLSLSPPDRIAVTNLFLCIVQRALNGPSDEQDHTICRERIIPESIAYLEREDVLPCFELLGTGPRFLQIHGSGNPGTISLAKLAGVDEKSSTLFQPDVHSFRCFSPEWTALRLLTFQNYSAGGKVGGSQTVGGKTTPVSGKAAPRRDSNAIHTYLRGASLLETLWLNLVPYGDLDGEPGEPVWEVLRSLASQEMPPLEKHRSFDHLTRSHLGRLVPLSRSLWLDERFETTENTVAMNYPGFADGVRDHSITVVVGTKNKKPIHMPLTCAKGGQLQEAWRSLPAVLLIHATSNDPKTRGALTLHNAAFLPSTNNTVDLWLGGVGGDQASTIDFFESSYRIPTCVFASDDANQDWRDAYETGVKLADRAAIRLEGKVSDWCQICDPKGSPLARKRLATDHFWSVLQQHHHILVEEANKAATSPSRSLDEEPDAPWPALIKRVSRLALHAICPAKSRRQTRARAFVESGRKLPPPARSKTKKQS